MRRLVSSQQINHCQWFCTAIRSMKFEWPIKCSASCVSTLSFPTHALSGSTLRSSVEQVEVAWLSVSSNNLTQKSLEVNFACPQSLGTLLMTHLGFTDYLIWSNLLDRSNVLSSEFGPLLNRKYPANRLKNMFETWHCRLNSKILHPTREMNVADDSGFQSVTWWSQANSLDKFINMSRPLIMCYFQLRILPRNNFLDE